MLRKAFKPMPVPALETLRAEEWGLEDFVGVCNRLLPRYLPDDAMDRRQREDVSVRLLRHYASQGLLDEPARQGREARYRYRHLLQVLVMRRLMREGLGTKAILEVMRQPDESLEALLYGGAQFNVTPAPQKAYPYQSPSEPARESARDEALGFLAGIRQRSQAAPAASVPAPTAQDRAKKQAAKQAADEPDMLERSKLEQPVGREDARPEQPASAAVLSESVSSKADLDDESLEGAIEREAHAESPQTPPQSPARWTRFEIAQGVELHLSDQARLPRTPAEREQLLEVIEHTLQDQLRRS